MNCQEALSLLYDIIDKEASDIDTKQVEAHLRNCRDCSGVYRLERSVNELIQEKLAHQRVTPRLDSLKAKVLSELDQMDCANRPQATLEKKQVEPLPRPALRLGWGLALGAAAVVLVGVILIAKDVFIDHRAYLPLEQAHWAAAEQMDRYRDQAVTSEALAGTSVSLAYDLSSHVNSFTMVGGQMETVDNIPMAHFVYHNQDRIVSVFVVDVKRMSVPEDLRETLVHRNGIEFYDHNCRGCRLVYHRVGDAWIITATTQRDVELLDFVPGHGPV
ncbi:MAG: zf-HC2 domain-containing protein [Candidatus Zixiibacteriota bacterium]